MKNLLIELHYLPSIEYFKQVLNHDTIYLEACENFQKQSYRNRCEILSANKISTLSIPVKTKKRLITEVEIDYTQRWLNDHWRAIVSAYNKSPYFEHYEFLFHDVFFQKYTRLFELNQELFSLCLKLLEIDKKIECTTDYQKDIISSITDYRGSIQAKKKDTSKKYQKYTQVFGEEFADNLSIVDLLFCEGNNATNILKTSLVKDQE